jgi:hypothetical protein
MIVEVVMIETPDEWVEMAWAARDASAPALNAARRPRFDSVKRAIGESDLPKSVIHSNSNVTRLKVR